MTRSEDAHIRVHGLQPVQVLAGLIGLGYLVAGAIGFSRTGVTDFAGTQQDVMLLGFMVNPLHNLVHVVVGLLGLLLATSSGLARTYGWLLFAGFGVAAIWGLMITGVISSNPVPGLGNPLHLNAADNWLHLGSAVLGLIVAIMPARKAAHVPVTTEPDDTATQTIVTGKADTPGAATETIERPKRTIGWHRRSKTKAAH